jgi:acyl dehydratase
VESVRIGEALPTIEKQVELVQMVAYCAATWDFHRYHYDYEYAALFGMRAPFADGQMFGAYLSQLVTDWMGPSGFLKRLVFKIASPVFPGDRLACWGKVADVFPEENMVRVELGIRGSDARDVVREAWALAELTSE